MEPSVLLTHGKVKGESNMGKYDFELDLVNDNSLKLIDERIKSNSKILEFGPANGRLTKHLCLNKNCVVDIVELDEKSGSYASKYANKSLLGSKFGNIENYEWMQLLKNEKYDYIIFADVLEHLYNPEFVLMQTKNFLKKDGSVLISIPNVAHNSIILNLLRDEFKYNELGLLDSTHIRFFTYNSFKRIIEKLEFQSVYENAVFIKVGSNEIDVSYDAFAKYDEDILMERTLGEAYQFIFELKTQGLKDNKIENKLADIISHGENKYTNYVSSSEKLSKQLEEARVYKSMYDIINNSLCWRITKPLRWSLDKTKFNLILFQKGVNSLRRNGVMRTYQKVKWYIDKGKDYAPIMFDENTNFGEVNSFKDFVQTFNKKYKRGENRIFSSEILIKYDESVNDEKVVLLISHEASLTGAPVALFHLAQDLKKCGYYPVYLSPKHGPLIKEICNDNIPVILYEQIYTTDFILRYRYLFHLIVINTIITCPLITALNATDTIVIWWIHESNLAYSETYQKLLPRTLSENIHVYAGGEYARKILLTYRPAYFVDSLLYSVPDIVKMKNYTENFQLGITGKKIFACVGSLEDRKGQDILVSAIGLLEKDLFKKCLFLFVGKIHSKRIEDAVNFALREFTENILYIEELPPKKMYDVYKQINCLICSSLDDPMPIVVTDALCLSKLVICSENTGSASIIKEMNAGIVYGENNPKLLADAIEEVVLNEDKFTELKSNARLAYEKYFSPEVFGENIKKILNKVEKQSELSASVSVVIPTYNAGNKFNQIIDILFEQKELEFFEIIIVDSGSSDGTIELCLSRGIIPIKISQEKFSHSYARNLGAEHAKGDIILFMTQDAMPSSVYWVKNMIEPILSENIAAVSCKEICPETTELFYKVNSVIHNKFMGITGNNKVGIIGACFDDITLRKNANLNDVACAIKNSIFKKFGYRYNFAEDLDLGIRLLKNGYRLKFLAENGVFHGHTRSIDYYLQRSIVETLALDKILNKSARNKNAFVNLVASYGLIENVISNMQYDIVYECSAKEFFGKMEDAFIQAFLKPIDYYISYCNSIKTENKITLLISNMARICGSTECNAKNVYDVAQNVKFYADHHLKHYILENKLAMTKENQNQIYDALRKNLAIQIGTEIAYVEEESELFAFVQELKRGV